MAVHVVFVKANDPSITTDPSICLVSQPFEVYMDTRIEEQLMNAYKQFLNEITVFEGNGSGWILSHIESLDANLWELDPLKASSYHRLPQWIINKRAVRNIKNTDQECFKWAILAGLHEFIDPTYPTRVVSYRHYEELLVYA